MVTAVLSRSNQTRSDQNQLIITKLYIPQNNPGLIARPEIHERLSKSVTGKITLVAAPAGWGKTTLLSQWAIQSSDLIAWVSLDEQDDNAASFWAYVLAALQAAEPGLGKETSSLLQTAPLPHERIMITLINEITRYGSDIHLILDDYHHIKNTAIHQVLIFLLDHAPDNFHLILSSRTTPPVSLARLRAQANLTEFTLNDLRFTRQEILAFLQHEYDRMPTTEEIEYLETITEGWITGIRLTSLGMRNSKPPPPNGIHRFMLTYLSEEVFAPLPSTLRDFLVQTVILDALTAPACDALTGAENSQAYLDDLEQRGLLIPLQESDHEGLRYHRLLRKFLLNRLEQWDDDRVRQLHHRAADWYAGQGDIHQAVHHALTATDYVFTAEIITRHAQRLWTQGEIVPLRDWLNQLPDHVIYADPNLCLVKAWVLFLTTNDLQDVKSLLSHVETGADQTGEALGIVYAIQAAYAARREELAQAITLSHQALDLLAGDNYAWRSAVLLGMGIAYSTLGEIDTASHYLMDAIIQAEASSNVLVTVIATYNLGRMLIYQGHLHQAAQMFRQALARAEQSQMGFPIAMTAHIGLGYVFYEWDALETARDHFLTGIKECKHLGNLEAPIKGYMNLASIQLAQHNIDEAIGMNYQAEQLAQRANLSRMTERVITHRARLWLYAGNITGAEHWAQKSGLTLQDEPEFLRETDYLTLAYIAVKQGKAEDALPLLSRLRAEAQTSGRTHSVIGILAVEALAWQALDHLERAVTCLEEALTLAQPGGFIRLFVDMGQPLAVLLRHAASRGILPGYIGRLLAAVENNATGQTTTPRQPLIDPLSDRELDVLRLMAEGLSNSEIAGELVVAMSTVKTHVKKIYRKLNVTNRTLAVARAQELAIL